MAHIHWGDALSLLQIENLSVRFDTLGGAVEAVKGLSFTLDRGQTLGLVGESGSGKTQSMLAVMGLLAPNGRASGRALLDGQDLLSLLPAALNRLRGNRIAMIFQDPMTSLNPYLTVERQMTEVLELHRHVHRKAARKLAVEALEAVKIPDAARRLRLYPHEFSGGMRQRVMIAMALLCEPDVLIADEPTTALDVTVQAQILGLLRDLQRDHGTAIVMITHDMGVVAGLCDEVIVLREGRIMEQGSAQDIFYRAKHPYTVGLLAAVPRLSVGPDEVQMTNAGSAAGVRNPAPLLSVRDLHVHFKIRGQGLPWATPITLKAVNGISFDLHAGETLGIVGESGCGKSTLARALLNLVSAASGSIQWHGQEMSGTPNAAWHAVREHAQMVFQDPLASLDPRMNAAQIIGEPLRTHRPGMSQAQVLTEVTAMVARVGLDEAHLYRYPHEFSGGQCQRIGIARALILKPKVIVCDEPVSALDVSIQAQIIKLLKQLQAEMGLALIFIAHDLAVVQQMSQRVLVMYLGRAMELADSAALYAHPRHPYTRALLSAVPIADPIKERGRVIELLQGDLPSPLGPPSGCVFRTRCPKAIAQCADQVPLLRPIAPGSEAACLLA